MILWSFGGPWNSFEFVYAGTKLVNLLLWKVPWIAILSYSLLPVWSPLLVPIKAFLTGSMIVGNLIDVYPFGMIAALISVLLYLLSFGLILCSFLSSILPPSLSSFLLIPRLPEPFSSFPQPVTLSNRLSTNMLRGSLSTPSSSLSFKITHAIHHKERFILWENRTRGSMTIRPSITTSR